MLFLILELGLIYIYLGFCDFERDLCGYKQASTDDFDWTRQAGSTKSLNTGPRKLHFFSVL